jgi:hypothetical protein
VDDEETEGGKEPEYDDALRDVDRGGRIEDDDVEGWG